MKKYLITAALAVAISGAFVSCSDDIAYDSVIDQKAKAFEEVFVEAYGTPAPNHTWGFKKSDVTRSANGWKSMNKITRSQGDNSCGTCIKPDMTNFPNYDTQYPNYTTPAPITDYERSYVKQWFEENHGFTEGLDIENFYVQQVWGEADKEYTVYYDHYDMNRNPTNYQDDYTATATLDYLCVGDGTNYTHLLDFNANNDGSGWDMIYMQNSSALSFKYASSWSSEEFKYFKCARINVPGIGEGWYVGFCCYGEKYDNGDRKLNYYDWQDEICDDWIVKIVPGEGTPDDFEETEIIEQEEIIEAGRVFCEDLGASSLSDIDYNDVVFDAIIVHETKSVDGEVIYENNYAKVCLLAAGGTLPVTVGGHEIHGVLSENKVGTNIMINTIKEEDRGKVNGAGVYEHAPVVIERIDGVNSIDDIEIFALYNNKVIEVTNNDKLAPYKICVPIGTRWAKERVDIGLAYKSFAEYCKTGPEVKFWEEETNISSEDLWDDSATPSPFLGYKEGQVIKYDVVTMKTVWKNNGSGAASWNGTYRFGKKGLDSNNECIATFKDAVWNKIKGSTFYLVVEGENPQIRVTDGWWQTTWQPNDIVPGNSLLTKNMDENDVWDGTWTLTVNLVGSDLVNSIDQKHLLFTGSGFTPVKLFYIE